MWVFPSSQIVVYPLPKKLLLTHRPNSYWLYRGVFV
uniref:Uncharacterized protein n=1 Tax=Anguilla anguilla TaxID=7936 RepID=A0A0E9TPH2_ANGAN